MSEYQPEYYTALTPQGFADLVNEAWMTMTDRGMKNIPGPEEARGHAFMLMALEWSCDLMRANMRDAHLIIGAALDLMQPAARRYYVAETIHQLASLGWRAEREPDDD